MYYCTECKKQHKSGKIYQDHKKYEKKEVVKIPSNKVLPFSYKEFQPDRIDMIKRQMNRFMKKLSFDLRRSDMYIHQINKMIIDERNKRL